MQKLSLASSAYGWRGRQRPHSASLKRQSPVGAKLRRVVGLNELFSSRGLHGLLAVALYDPIPSATTIARVPLWAWSGGVFGAIFIAHQSSQSLSWAGPLTLRVVAGQMIAALAVDHFWMAGRSGAANRLATNDWRRIASRRRGPIRR